MFRTGRGAGTCLAHGWKRASDGHYKGAGLTGQRVHRLGAVECGIHAAQPEGLRDRRTNLRTHLGSLDRTYSRTSYSLGTCPVVQPPPPPLALPLPAAPRAGGRSPAAACSRTSCLESPAANTHTQRAGTWWKGNSLHAHCTAHTRTASCGWRFGGWAVGKGGGRFVGLMRRGPVTARNMKRMAIIVPYCTANNGTRSCWLFVLHFRWRGHTALTWAHCHCGPCIPLSRTSLPAAAY